MFLCFNIIFSHWYYKKHGVWNVRWLRLLYFAPCIRKTSQCVSFFRKEKVMIWNLKVSKYGFIKHLSWYTNVTEHFHTLFSLSLFTYQLFILAFISDEICIKNKKHVQNEISFQLKKMYALFFKNTKPFKVSKIPKSNNMSKCLLRYRKTMT